MSSPPGSPGVASWRQEAEAVVADIAPHVAAAALSSLPGDASSALLNVTTLEGRRLTVRLSPAGFTLCGEGHDATDGGRAERVYETPYALLHDVSAGYTAAFGRSLADRLGRLTGDGVEAEQAEQADRERTAGVCGEPGPLECGGVADGHILTPAPGDGRTPTEG